MPSMFVRGNVLSVVNADAHSVSNKGLQTGDTLRVGARKKGGWLRVRCSRTGKVISIRSSHHLCLASKADRPASQIDLLIRESQLKSAETTIDELTESRDMWQRSYFEKARVTTEKIARAEASADEWAERARTLQQEFSDRKKWWEEETGEFWDKIESLEQQLAIAHRLLDEATKQNAELLDERTVLQEKLKKSEADFAQLSADMGWVEMPPGFVPTAEETAAAEALLTLRDGDQ
jgi:DNA repair exonuclease SbcCD ATPase subunit